MSAIVKVSSKAPEQGTFGLVFDFYELAVDQASLSSSSESASPTALTWSLRRRDGSVVNGRSNVAITPGESVTITLSGDDLSLADGDFRVLTIDGTYSSTLGDGIPLKVEAHFYIENFLGVF